MRALFISANTERINVPTMPLGLACVAEATRRAGHEIFLVDLMAESDPGDKIRRVIADFRPEIIGISIRNVDDQDMAKPRFLVDRARGVKQIKSQKGTLAQQLADVVREHADLIRSIRNNPQSAT